MDKDPPPPGPTSPFPPDKVFDSDGWRIQFIDTGGSEGADTVFLIHAMGTSTKMWQPLVTKIPILPDLAAAGFRVIAMDLRGHGTSQKSSNHVDYGLSLVEDHVRLMDHLGVEEAHVVGASLGAEVAIKLATLYPDRVQSLSAGGSGWSEGTDWYHKTYGAFGNPCSCCAKGGSCWGCCICMTRSCWYPCCCPCLCLSLNGEVPSVRAMLAAGKSMNLVMDVKEDDLRKLDIPVCGVAGEKDPERKFVERMQGVVPDFSFTIVPGKDHDGMFHVNYLP